MSGTSRTGRAARRRTRLRTKVLVAGVAVLTAAPLALTAGSAASAAPVGQGFNLNPSDLRFILKQIKIAEQHADTFTAGNPCGTMRGNGPDQIPSGEVGDTLPWGLRLIDGTCNNIVPGNVTVGSADQNFPRLVPKALKPAENGDPDGPGPSGAVDTSYTQTAGTVIDSQPRVISNLIVDQTDDNPAAVAAAGENPEVTPSGAFFIPNVAPDVGLSAPYNSWFTLFGQFFDHGLDLVNKGNNGTVFMPLQTDDPLYDATSQTNFMVLTRATHDGDHEANNQTSPWVDQSQTYTSHPSHQVFLREYALDAAGDPQPTGSLITGAGDGMATWADVRSQAASMLGIALSDADALSIPLLATDPYGRFVRGPNGLPQLVVPSAPGGLVEGNLTTPVSTAGATPTGHAFLDDIAHNAVPKSGFAADGDGVVTPGLVPCERANVPAGCVNEYDDEMLDAHFIAGDGRVNENIGLTTVHHVFHSEHNRLVEEIDSMIVNAENVAGGITDTEEADWKATNRYTARDGGYDYGERLFQAARFVTEMEYQHLAFEEFIRKVQPMVALFGEGGTGYNTSIRPAIKAEFAHAVYRFGHSMLTESVDRVKADGTTRDDIDLFDAFLNPPSFMAGGRTPDQAAGDVVRGMTRQVGNELDEFVTEALRNQLLGLPLDLASLNMARARDTGIPTLNAARRSFFEASNNSALAPYESWSDFNFSLKHPESLINFIAAYGTHPTITGTMAQRRAAATLIVSPETGQVQPRDAADFMFGTNYDEAADNTAAVPAVDEGPGTDGILNDDPDTGDVDESADNTPAVPAVPAGPGPDGIFANDPATDWENVDGKTVTGVDDIDLWVGGLAEKQFVFGGLLGSTFNYVFEQQMEDLQFGDRFYYLSRTAGLNMLTQLEGNSFSELIQRNTDVEGLPADSFSRPAYVFNLAKLGTSGPVPDDDATEWNEAALLTRMPNGTIRYGGPEHVVFNGTPGDNRVWSSEGDDTIRGNDGNDWMQGGDGNDNHIGGLGDDILLDTNGDDTLKGGDGNDTLSSGQGFAGDLNQGGRGNDFIDHDDMAEAFAGPGDDWFLGGPEDDTVFGDDGDDWLENGATVNGTGGGAFNLLQGDNGAPFQDDPNEPGHDVLIGYGGETDYDSEGGDDVMLLGPGIQRSEGMLGFDYATHDSDPTAADSDMDLTGLLPPSVETNKDRFDLVEALSGWNLNDTLRGDDRDAAAMVDHELTAAGTARVAGLEALLGGATTFTGGNILMGGAGTDLIEGRGGDDVIDGDAQLNVRISVRSGLTEPTTQIDSVETLAGVSARLLAGTVNPGQLRIVREIQTPANGTAVDVALFSDVRANYVITRVDTNTVTVAHTGGLATDGIDTVSNVETLRFTDQNVATSTIVAPTPVATFSPTTTLAFGLRDTGVQATQPVTVTNDGTANLTVSTVAVTGAGFAVTNNGCTAAVAPAGTCTITVGFTPTQTTTAVSGQLSVTTNAAATPTVISLTGQGRTPVARPTITLPATTDFGRRATGTTRVQNVRLTNNGPVALLLAATNPVTTTGQFTATLGTCPVAPATLAAGRSCNLSVTYRPTSVGPVTGSLTVTSNAVSSPTTVALTGTGR